MYWWSIISKYSTFHQFFYKRYSKSNHVLKNISRLFRFFAPRAKQKSMDFFGKAIRNYANGDTSSLYYIQNCLRKKYHRRRFSIDLSRYFRKYDDLNHLEKKMIALTHGDILDIGCNTGYYMNHLMKQGEAMGLDVSQEIIRIAHENGFSNCYKGDIFKYKFPKRFDTVTLFESDLAITGSMYHIKKLLKKLHSLLRENGQVLMIIRYIHTLKYWNVVYVQEYLSEFGPPFRCCYINIYYLTRLAKKFGFKFEILDKGTIKETIVLHLVRLTK